MNRFRAINEVFRALLGAFVASYIWTICVFLTDPYWLISGLVLLLIWTLGPLTYLWLRDVL